MAKWPITGFDGSNRLLGTQIFAAFGGDYQHATEANTQQEVRDSYTGSNLRAYILAFDGGAELRLRTNTADDTQVLTITGTGEFEDTSNTDNLVSGDLICLDEQETGGMHGNNFTLGSFQMTLDAASNVPPLFRAGLSGEGFQFIQGPVRLILGEADAEYTMRATRTLRDLRVFVTSHSTNGATTLRKNRADGSLTVSVTGTGEFTDFVNTDSFVAGDEADLQRSSGSFTLSILSLEANTSSGIIHTWAGIGTPTSWFMPGGGTETTTEVEAEVEAEDTTIIQNLFVNCTLNVETRTIRTRKNQTNGTVSVNVTGTGIFEDTTNSDSLAAEDDFTIQQDSGSSGSNTYNVAVEWETSAGPSPQNISVPVAVLDIVGVTPTVTPGAVTVTVPVAIVSISAVTPVVDSPITRSVTPAIVQIVAIAPTVTVGIALVVVPVAVLTISG
ncbi:hypothetical protein LCGC14_2097990, partial [marine sediment metagenome]